jgi:glutamine amidotransferase
MRIQILDLGINNVKSVVAAFSGIPDAEVFVNERRRDCKRSQLTVLPGVGKFGTAVEVLEERGFRDYLNEIAEVGDCLLGICLGMHLLGNGSAESPGFSGLGLIPGECLELPTQISEKLPNIGWASTKNYKQEVEFNSLAADKDFYFVHSYFFKELNPKHVLCKSYYGEFEFTSGVINENVAAFQFHPEKSSKIGEKLFSEIVNWSNG